MSDDSDDPDPFQQALGPLRTRLALSRDRCDTATTAAASPSCSSRVWCCSSGFWRRVVPAITQPIRAIVPDLPLGAHTIADAPRR